MATDMLGEQAEEVWEGPSPHGQGPVPVPLCSCSPHAMGRGRLLEEPDRLLYRAPKTAGTEDEAGEVSFHHLENDTTHSTSHVAQAGERDLPTRDKGGVTPSLWTPAPQDAPLNLGQGQVQLCASACM